MTFSSLERKDVEEALNALRTGGSQQKGAAILGMSRSAFKNRLNAAGRFPDLGGVPVSDWSRDHYAERRYEMPRPRFVLEPALEPRNLDFDVQNVEHVMIIPDRHRDPRYPHRVECDRWIGREGAARRPKYVVDLGDHMTFDSVSRHDKNHQQRGRYKPTIKADLDHMAESHKAFREGCGDWKPILKKARGNHESRLWAYENEQPESVDSHTHRYNEILLQFGWKEHDFGQIFYIGGCGFVHAPFNGLGKAMGGKTSSHRAGALLCTSLFHGHSHRFGVYTDSKLDPRGGVTVVECGCALPYGEYEDYATLSPLGWAWGILFVKVANGVVLDLEFVSMKTLKDRWG